MSHRCRDASGTLSFCSTWNSLERISTTPVWEMHSGIAATPFRSVALRKVGYYIDSTRPARCDPVKAQRILDDVNDLFSVFRLHRQHDFIVNHLTHLPQHVQRAAQQTFHHQVSATSLPWHRRSGGPGTIGVRAHEPTEAVVDHLTRRRDLPHLVAPLRDVGERLLHTRVELFGD